jgi:hypothetical protein
MEKLIPLPKACLEKGAFEKYKNSVPVIEVSTA